MRVSVTASSNLPGTRANPGASSHTSCGLKIMPSTHTAPTTSSQRRGHQVGKLGGLALALGGEVLREHRNEGRGKRALGEQIARQIGNAEAEQEGVVGRARAEQARHDHFAHQAGDAAQKNRRGDHARRAEHVFAVGGPPARDPPRDEVSATGFLFDAAHFHLPVDLLGLRQAKPTACPAACAEAVPAATPQRSASVKSPCVSMDHTKAAASASPAPMGQSTSTRGGSASMMAPSIAPMAPRLPSESTTVSGPMARMRAAASRK